MLLFGVVRCSLFVVFYLLCFVCLFCELLLRCVAGSLFCCFVALRSGCLVVWLFVVCCLLIVECCLLFAVCMVVVGC